MDAEQKPAGPTRKKRWKFILKLVLVFITALILLLFFLIPAVVSSEKARQTILAKINSSVQGQADFASLSMGWLKGIKVTDISYSDHAGQISFKAKQITTKPHYISLLTGALSLGKTVIDQPQIEITLKNTKPTNKAQSAPQHTQPVGLPIKKIDLVVNNGNLTVTGAQSKTIQLLQINSQLNLRPPGQQTNFSIDTILVDEGKEAKISATAQVKPKRKAGWAFKGTTGSLTVEVNDLDVGSLGPIFDLVGVEIQGKGRVSANITCEIKDGQLESLSGSVKGTDLDVTGEILKGDRLKTSRLDFDVRLQAQKELINIEKFAFEADWANVKASGTVPTTFESLADFVEADSPYDLHSNFECDLAAILSQMPRTFGLKEGTNITSGRLTGNIETVSKAGQRKVIGQVSLAGLAGMVGAKSIALSQPVNVEIEISSDKKTVKYDKLNLSASFANISCTGTSELLKYDAHVNLSQLQTELGQFADLGQYTMAGQVVSQGQVSGKEDKIVVIGSSACDNLRLTSRQGLTATEPRIEVSYSLVVELPKDIVNVNFIKANASFGQFAIEKATLPLSEEAATQMNLPVVASNIDLAKLQPFAVLFAAFPQDMQLAGIVQSQVSVTGKKDTYQIVTDATTIKNFKLISPGKQPFIQDQVSFVFDGDYNPTEGNWVIRKFELITPDIKIKSDLEKLVKGDTTKLRGRLDCEYDWAALSTLISAFLPEGLTLQGKMKDVITLSSEYPTGQPELLMANLTSEAKVGFDRAEYMGLDFGATEVEIKIENGVLTIAPFSTTVNNGQLSFAAETDFRQKPAILKIPQPIQIAKGIQINDKTTRKLLTYLNPIFAKAFNVSGVANFNCEKLSIPMAAANKNDLVVIGTVSMTNVRLDGSDLLGQILSVAGGSAPSQEITVHPTRFILQNGFLRYEDMQIDIGDNPINFKGVIGLDRSLDMVITLPYTTEGRTVRIGEETSGQRILLPLRGTIDNPQLDLGKLLEQQLRGRLEDELRKGLEGLFK